MFSLFNDFPLRQKLTFIIVAASGLMVLVSGLVIICNAAFTIRRNTIYNLTVMTRMIAVNTTAALAFQDPKTASELLASLHVAPHVLAAAVYDEHGCVFARYHYDARSAKAVSLPERLGIDYAQGCNERRKTGNGWVRSDWSRGFIEVAQPICLNGRNLGMVLVRADLGWFFRQLRVFVFAAVIAMFLLIALAYFLSLRVQRIITRPIEELAASMEKVSRDNDYTVRVKEPGSQDEIAVLMTGFNNMLAQIQKRDLELERVSRQKDEFLRNMSHELRTPLNAIIGFSELLQSTFYGPLNDKQLGYVSDINTSGRHLLDLINEILDHAKIETDGFSLNPEEFNLREYLDESLVMIRSQVIRQSLSVVVDVDENLPPTIVADRKRLKQMLYNLLANAVKFTESGGSITLRARKVSRSWIESRLPEAFQSLKSVLSQKIVAEYCAIMVEDTGIGIDAAHLRKIFMPFEQVENSVSRQYGGTGLGLALCKSFIEMHHGIIWVESELGFGSTFIFVLPLE